MSKKLKWSLIIGVLVTLSCTTPDDAVRDIPEYDEAVRDRISEYIDNSDYTEAVYLCRILDDPRVDDLESIAVNGLIEACQTALDAGSYPEAIELRKSLSAAGIPFEPGLDEIYVNEAAELIRSGALTPGLALYQNKLTGRSGISIDDGQMELFIDAALELKNKTVMKDLLERFPVYAAERGEEIKALAEWVPEKDELISGTVTILVDRGIRLEKGVGYPDRVIGSGFYIDSRGYILTNYHVISSEVDPEYEGYSRLYIKYDRNEEKIPASVVGWDASLDIALLKVAFEPDYVYSFSNGREYKPGEKIYAIGSPGGLDKTITSGIISAPGNRRLLPLGDTIQVDVPINAGNSGGPVIDTRGNLVGVVFAGIEQFEGVNFIIPVKWILSSMGELYTEGRNRQSWLGFTVHESNEGLEIIYVMPGTSGFSAGVQAGDRLIGINGEPVTEIPDAQQLILDNRPGTLLNITVERDGALLEYLLVAEEREDIPMEKALELDSRKNLVAPFFGMTVDRGNDEVIGQEYVIRKVYRGMSADETGLSVDDPFSIVNWYIDDENDVLITGIRIKKRKAGFLETVIQLGNYIDINNTI